MPRFFLNNKVRILRKRAAPGLPDEIGIVIDALPRLPEVARGEDVEDIPQLYLVLTVENCPPGCSKTEIYSEDELELLSWGLSLDIYQYGG
jgi:hypothetical protein